MSKFLAGVAAVGLLGLAAMPVTATAAERQSGVTNNNLTVQSTDVSAQRHWRRYGHRYYGPRRYWGPRYGYYRPYPYYGAYGYPYGYYRPAPFVALGVGPFGFRFF